MRDVMTVDEVAELCRIHKGKAYEIMRTCNLEMQKQGYIIIRGRVNRAYLMKRLGME